MSSYRRWSSGRSHALVRPQYGAAQRHRDHERGYTCRAFRLQPHRVETFKLSTDLLFVDKACPGSDPGCATSSGFTATRPTLPWCRASMKSRRSRHNSRSASRADAHFARSTRLFPLGVVLGQRFPGQEINACTTRREKPARRDAHRARRWTALIRSLLTRAAMSSAVQNETAISSESPALRSRSAVGNGSASTRG